MRRWTVKVSCALLLASSATAHAQVGSSFDAVLAAAKKERALNVVAGASAFGNDEAAEQLEAAFNRKYGFNIRLRLATGPSMPAMAVRLREELRSGVKATTDLFFGTESVFVNLLKSSVLTNVTWAETFGVKPEVVFGDGIGVVTNTAIGGMTFNPTLLKPALAPRSYEDLVDPLKAKAWAGKLAMPVYSDWLTELSLFWPRERVLDFTRKLTKTVSGYIRYTQPERIASGEFAVMAHEADAVIHKGMMQRISAPLEANVPSEFAIVHYNMLGVPKHAVNPNLAVLFAAFVVSPEGQAITNRVAFFGNHLEPTNYKAQVLAESRVAITTAKQLYDFYVNGGDATLTQEIETLLNR